MILTEGASDAAKVEGCGFAAEADRDRTSVAISSSPCSCRKAWLSNSGGNATRITASARA